MIKEKHVRKLQKFLQGTSKEFYAILHLGLPASKAAMQVTFDAALCERYLHLTALASKWLKWSVHSFCSVLL